VRLSPHSAQASHSPVIDYPTGGIFDFHFFLLIFFFPGFVIFIVFQQVRIGIEFYQVMPLYFRV
jgi:hypothetical protein